MVEINNPSVAQPPPTQGQQGTPQVAARTPLRRSVSGSPCTPHGAEFSASSSTTTPSESGTKFRSIREIYEQGAANEGMNSLFVLYCQVDDPIHFEDAIKDRKWIEAMDDEINSIEKNKTWELVDLPKDKEEIEMTDMGLLRYFLEI